MVIATKKKNDSLEGLTGDKYFSLIEHAADGIAILQGGVFKLVNTALARISGYDKEELLGMPFANLLTPESQKLTMERYHARLAGKKVLPTYEIKAVTKNGEVRDIEINAALTEYEGRLADEVIVRDITERKEAEEVFQAERNKLQSLIDAMEDGLTIQDKDYNIIYQNELVRKIFGDHLGEKCYRVYEGKDKLCDGCPVEKAFRDGKSHTSERKVVIPSGEITFWENTANPIRDARGRVVSCLEINRNITERKQAEEELRESQQFSSSLLESSPNPISVVNPDTSVRYVNPAFEKLTGFTLAEIAGRKAPYPWWPEGQREEITAAFKNAMAHGGRRTSRNFQKKSGERFWVAVNSAPIVHKGKPLYFILNWLDITERKQAEEELRQAKEQFQVLVEESPLGVSVIRKDGRYQYLNHKFVEMFGYTLEDVPTGRDWFAKAYPDPEYRNQVISTWNTDAKLSKRGEVRPQTYTVTCKDGSEKIIRFRPVVLETGDYFVIYEDITERKQMEQQLQEKNEQLDAQNEELRAINEELQATEQHLQEKNEQLDAQNEELTAINEELRVTEEELQQSQEKLERMFESVSDGILVTDLDGTILKVNEKVVQMHGLASDDELLGKKAFEFAAPADQERIANSVQKALKEGLIRGQEYTLLRADGSEFPAELSTSALRDASGNVIGLITIGRDITKRKQMEELFKTVTNSSPVGIYIVQDSKFQVTNPQFQKLTGYTEDELIGMDSLALVLPKDRDMVREKAVKMLKGERSSPYQFRVVNKTGETRWVMETVTSIQYRGRRATLGNYIDITERKQAEEKEKRLQQELDLTSRLASIGQLAAGVAHEINNPLTGVIGFSHLMMSRDIPDDMKEDLQVINSEAKRVAKIVENLLTFAHQRKPGREYVDINSIIARVLELRAYEMKVNNIEVETQLAPDLPCTMADAGQLQQVFLDIVLNAEHFMTEAHNRGKLLVKTERIDGNIQVSFTDDGPGISKENLDKVFNPFFTTKEVGAGTGLGLSICHGIITQHKGRIYAQSELGQGTTFVVELPIADDSTQAGQAKVTKKEPQKPKGAKILVVDDEPAILTFLRRLLTQWGHSVETINNANAALNRLQSERYSLILLDIKLPGMSGVELYRHIEEIAPALTRRIMFITGDVMETSTRDFLDRTKVPHITKPLNIELLKKTINHALNQTHVAATTPG